MKMTCQSLLQVAVLLLFGTLRAKQRRRQKASTLALKPATGIAFLQTYLFMSRTWDALELLKRTVTPLQAQKLQPCHNGKVCQEAAEAKKTAAGA